MEGLHMEIHEVPPSQLIVSSSNTDTLVTAVDSILRECEERSFNALAFVRGTSRTGRIFLINRHWDATPLPRPFTTAHMVVREMERLGKSEARYDPSENPGMVKGWEIRRAEVNHKPIAIIWTAWVPRVKSGISTKFEGEPT
jgi:hypothetical protein